MFIFPLTKTSQPVALVQISFASLYLSILLTKKCFSEKKDRLTLGSDLFCLFLPLILFCLVFIWGPYSGLTTISALRYHSWQSPR